MDDLQTRITYVQTVVRLTGDYCRQSGRTFISNHYIVSVSKICGVVDIQMCGPDSCEKQFIVENCHSVYISIRGYNFEKSWVIHERQCTKVASTFTDTKVASTFTDTKVASTFTDTKVASTFTDRRWFFDYKSIQ